MRIIYGDCVIAISRAVRENKKLIFKTYDGKYFYTGDYFHEITALNMLSDLAINGYIKVEELYIKD